MTGRTTRRGYGTQHQRLRAAWRPYVATGRVTCARCGLAIQRGQSWDLGHDDHDRRLYRGPEHAKCNRSAGGKSAHRPDPKPKPVTRWT